MMLSRVAESIYWLGRYIERAENYSRFIEVNFNLSLDLPPGIKEQWKPLVITTGDRLLYEELYKDYSKEKVIYFLSFQKENPNSIYQSILNARENARIVRESISRETWETLNGLYYFLQQGEKKKIWKKEDPHSFFLGVKQRIHEIYGIAYNTEPRNERWYFNKIGQYLERADKTSRFLDVKYHILLPSAEEVGTPLDYIHWAALLKSVGGFNTFRRIYGNLYPDRILQFLMLDEHFPRSIFFCIKWSEVYLHEISGKHSGYSNQAEKTIGALRSELEFMDVPEIIDQGVHEYTDQLQLKINNISNSLYDQYFRIRTNFVPQTQTEG